MSGTRTISLRAEPLSHEAFAAFGHLPAEEKTEHDTADLEFLWNDGHVNYIGHRRDEVSIGNLGLRCELLNRHDTHTQTLMSVDVDAVIVVAPAEVDFSHADHFETVRAFVMRPFECAHLNRGTWHWGPFPVEAESVRLFNVQGRGYAKDNGIAWLTRDHATTYEIEVSARD